MTGTESKKGSILWSKIARCDQIEAISATFYPAALAFSKRGIKLDLLVPPYSLEGYAARRGRQEQKNGTEVSGWYSDIMTLRRCVVEAVANLPNIRVHGFDNDDAITGDLTNYQDIMHIQKPEIYEKILKGISAGTSVLTPENWADYERTLTARVLALQAKIP